MKAIVTRAYTDRLDSTVHYPGQEVNLSEARLAELSAAGFVLAAPEPPPDAAAAEAPSLSDMTSRQLRDYIESRGGSAPAKATKARLAEIAGEL